MNFLRKIFGTKQSSMEKFEIKDKQETKSDKSSLKCSGCKKEYVIGTNAVAVCLESQAPGTNILVVYDNDTERVDLVAPIDPSNKGAFERSKPGWKTIQDSLSQGQQRKWKCNLCNQVNSYPDLYSAINEHSNRYSSTNELDPKPPVIVHTALTNSNSIAQRLLGLSADNMLSQTYLETSGRYVIEELGLIGSPDALRFLNEILASHIYGKEIKGQAKRALNIHNKKTQGIQDKNTEVNATNDADAHIKKGYARYLQNDFMGAISDYTKAIEIDPKNEEAFYYRGYARNGLKNYEGALQDFDKVIELNDKYSGIYNNRGIAKDRLRNYSAAIEDYSKAIEIDSKDANAYYNRGYDKYRFKDYLGAIEDYTKALEINPKLDYIKKDIENAKAAQRDNIKYTQNISTSQKETAFVTPKQYIENKNEYKAIKISNQEWMIENLSIDCFSNGDIIPEAKTDTEWKKASTEGKPAWCYYGNNSEKGRKFGKLYNWFAVNDPRGLAPEGWRIPTFEDFDLLKSSMNNDGNKLKAIGEGKNEGSGTNKSEFSAKLAGYRDNDAVFYGLETGNRGCTFFWSSSFDDSIHSLFLLLASDDANISLLKENKGSGLSVRCIKVENVTSNHSDGKIYPETVSKCDVCSKDIRNNSGYAFFSDVMNIGNMLICEECTQRLISEQSFAAPRKHTGTIDLVSSMNILDELMAESIVANCKKFNFSPEKAKSKARELAIEFYKDNKKGQDIIYNFWKSR